MALYSLFSYNVEVQYKSCFLSKAMVFTFITTFLNIILPFIISYRSRGFWLKSYNFFEQPTIYFTYNYVLVAETNDLSLPIICSDAPDLPQDENGENCAEIQVEEIDYNNNKVNDMIKFRFKLNVPADKVITSIIFITALDFQLKSTCPLQMQSLSIISQEFAHPSSGFRYNGDLVFYQTSHLPCLRNHVDIRYNSSLLNAKEDFKGNIIDYILDEYFNREATTLVNKINSRIQYGKTTNFILDVNLRIPEMEIRYTPGILQELKWAWPQYLSLVVVFYWIFNKIKCFVFNNRLVMAWKDIPWKKK